jgi:hypothetical protein
VGEAVKLIERLTQEHPSIPNWEYFRYDVLPDELFNHRVAIERMLIRDYASLLNNNRLESIGISEFKLVNDKVDT